MLKIYCDGGSRGNPGHAASAFAVYKYGKVIHKESHYIGKATNNVAEYKAVGFALDWLKENEVSTDNTVKFILDSELVVKQLAGVYKVKNSKLALLVLEIKKKERKFPFKVYYSVVTRESNQLADSLVNKELDKKISRL